MKKNKELKKIQISKELKCVIFNNLYINKLLYNIDDELMK